MFNLKKAVKVSLSIKEWNMDDLARAMNKPKGTINSNLYNGNPTLSTINNIAKEFGYELSEFIKLGED